MTIRAIAQPANEPAGLAVDSPTADKVDVNRALEMYPEEVLLMIDMLGGPGVGETDTVEPLTDDVDVKKLKLLGGGPGVSIITSISTVDD